MKGCQAGDTGLIQDAWQGERRRLEPPLQGHGRPRLLAGTRGLRVRDCQAWQQPRPGEPTGPPGQGGRVCPAGGSPAGRQKRRATKCPLGLGTWNGAAAAGAWADLPGGNMCPSLTSPRQHSPERGWPSRRGRRRPSWLRSRKRGLSPAMKGLGCLRARPLGRGGDTRQHVGSGQKVPSPGDFPKTGGTELASRRST